LWLNLSNEFFYNEHISRISHRGAELEFKVTIFYSYESGFFPKTPWIKRTKSTILLINVIRVEFLCLTKKKTITKNIENKTIWSLIWDRNFAPMFDSRPIAHWRTKSRWQRKLKKRIITFKTVRHIISIYNYKYLVAPSRLTFYHISFFLKFFFCSF